jgi:hypothetical protein
MFETGVGMFEKPTEVSGRKADDCRGHPVSLDHLRRLHQNRVGNFDAERFRGFAVNE